MLDNSAEHRPRSDCPQLYRSVESGYLWKIKAMCSTDAYLNNRGFHGVSNAELYYSVINFFSHPEINHMTDRSGGLVVKFSVTMETISDGRLASVIIDRT